MPNRYIPISLTARDRTCLVVGGGTVALRKIDTLLNYAVAVTVVAPELDPKIEYYGQRDMLSVVKRQYLSPEAARYNIVIAASDNEVVNKQVYDDTRDTPSICNVVDNPPLCDFIFPAVVRRDTLTLAVSTDGTAPFLAGHLRLILENIFPEHWAKLVGLAGIFRNRVQQKWSSDVEKKNACYERFLEADWKTMLKEKNEAEVESELDRMLTF
ncbi:MAG: bifunctional precorrin-2 dehydrogenase/sirohydrochlorin ferrochelatase [candidate division Zixibacteria bacterium]|jgi:uroporphyrin-III C-methyltransferase/precorrin-2 dehydrogenase/sirohydrochlorin ferrochelatase|nr:bifunctional precorrin-2 dehydrogenase/sirohydrochlorin ferrochelatase [candidate division Zixibacteria bacterium]